MPKVYFTADTHFNHANVIKYCARLWFRALRRRGGKKDLTWDRFGEMLHKFSLPRSSAMSFQTFHGVARG